MNLAAVRDRIAGSDLTGFRTEAAAPTGAKVGKAQQGKAQVGKIRGAKVGKMRGAKVGKIPAHRFGKLQAAMVGKAPPRLRTDD